MWHPICQCWNIRNYFRLIRQAKKESQKEEATLEEKRELQFTIQELALNIERQDAQLRHLSRIVAELGNISERLSNDKR